MLMFNIHYVDFNDTTHIQKVAAAGKNHAISKIKRYLRGVKQITKVEFIEKIR